MSGEMNRVIIPCSESNAEALNDEFSPSEMREILFDAYRERQEDGDDELANYSSLRAIRDDDSLKPAERKRKAILWHRRNGR